MLAYFERDLLGPADSLPVFQTLSRGLGNAGMRWLRRAHDPRQAQPEHTEENGERDEHDKAAAGRPNAPAGHGLEPRRCHAERWP